VAAVIDKVQSSPQEEILYGAVNATGMRGFMLMTEDRHIHTMFTLPCTPEQKVDSLFKEMLLAANQSVDRPFMFKTIPGYNDQMIRFYRGSANHAKVGYCVDA